jgi:hypothetical protein
VDCVRRWPVHPQPRKDELLSSWLQELARGNGQKLQAFSDCVFGTDHQIWNRDVDRLAPRWLRANLVRHTGVPRQRETSPISSAHVSAVIGPTPGTVLSLLILSANNGSR